MMDYMDEIKKREFQVGQINCVVKALSNGEKFIIEGYIEGQKKPAISIDASQLEDVDVAMNVAETELQKLIKKR